VTAIPGLFVVGTDTGVGKTRIAASIAHAMTQAGHVVGVLKPVATGAVRFEGGWRSDDADQLMAAIGGGVSMQEVCPLAFAEPLAPPVAARRSGSPLTKADVERATRTAIDQWQSVRGADVMVVEGVGGLLCPLAEGMTVADLAIRLDYPLVIVARRGLGTLNHTLLTVEAALGRSLRVAGVVLNGSEPARDPVAEATNPEELTRWLGSIPLLANLSYREEGRTMPFVIDGADWYTRSSWPRLPFTPA